MENRHINTPENAQTTGSFNPRSRTGNDYNRSRDERRYGVSIHVPARGTTVQSLAFFCYNKRFQSTFPHGERRCSGSGDTGSFCCFNPRSRTGNDIICPVHLHSLAYSFNPRSRTGNDSPKPPYLWIPHQVSIHVPARGTTD